MSMRKSRSKHTVMPPPPRIPESFAALASGMSDDFNNILTTVMGACSLINKEYPANGELLSYIALIRASAERAATLSDRLMSASNYQINKSESVDTKNKFDYAKTGKRDKKSKNDIVPPTNPSGGDHL